MEIFEQVKKVLITFSILGVRQIFTRESQADFCTCGGIRINPSPDSC
jgi:hypothetical protein